MAILKKSTGSEEFYDSAQRTHPLVEEFMALANYKELVVQFVSRSIKTRYKRSFLGVGWTMLNPLFTMIVLTLVFSNVFRFTIENYPIYVLSGLMVWNFFSSSTSAAMGEMIWSSGLLNRIYIPKMVFPVSAIGTGLVNLFLALIPLALIALVLRIPFTLSLLTLPLSILLIAMFALGVGMFLATAAVYFADMVPVYEVILTIWLYLSPIIYPIEIVPEQFLWAFKLNPLFSLIEIFRAPWFEGVIPGWSVWLPAAGYAVLSLTVGGLVFASRAKDFAYRI